MKGQCEILRHSKGFFLIEVIVVITLASVLFAMMFSYFGTAVLDSAQPIIRMDQTLALTQVAEQITADYRYKLDKEEHPLDALKNNLAANPSGYGSDYSVEVNDFFKFDTDRKDVPFIEGGLEKKFLKVKIRHDQTHEALTLLFTEQ